MAEKWVAVFAPGADPATSEPVSLASYDDANPDIRRFDPDALAAKGYSVVYLDSDPRGKVWKGDKGTFEPPPPKRVVPATEFIRQFTPEQFVALLDSKDASVRMFVFLLGRMDDVSLDDPLTVAALDAVGDTRARV